MVTPDPTSSTKPAPSCPPIIGPANGTSPTRWWSSEWQSPAAATRTRTSPARGGSSSISSTFQSVPASYSTAACVRMSRALPCFVVTLFNVFLCGAASFLEVVARVNRERDAGDVAGGIRGEPDDRVGDVHGICPRDRQQVHLGEPVLDVVASRVLQVGAEGPVQVLVVDHRRVDGGRADRVDPDEVVGEFVGQGVLQGEHAVLGGLVVAESPAGGDCRAGARQGDGPAVACLDHDRNRRLDRDERAGQRDIYQLAELLHVDRPGILRPGDDRRVRDDDVKPPAELGDTLVKDGLDHGQVPDVGLAGDNPPAERLDLLDGLREVVLGGEWVAEPVRRRTRVDRDDVGALLRDPDGMRPALPARRPGDEGDLTFQKPHAYLLRPKTCSR